MFLFSASSIWGGGVAKAMRLSKTAQQASLSLELLSLPSLIILQQVSLEQRGGS